MNPEGLASQAQRIAKKTEQAIQILFKLSDRKLDFFVQIHQIVQNEILANVKEIYRKYPTGIFTPENQLSEEDKRELEELNKRGIRKTERKYFKTIKHQAKKQLKVLSLFFENNEDLIEVYNQEISPLLNFVDDKRNIFLSNSEKAELKSALLGIKALMESANGKIAELKDAIQKQIDLADNPPHSFIRGFIEQLIAENNIFNVATKAYGYHIAKLHEFRQRINVIGQIAISTITHSIRSANTNIRYNKKLLVAPPAVGIIYGIKERDITQGIIAAVVSFIGIYTIQFVKAIKLYSKMQYNEKIDNIVQLALKRPIVTPSNGKIIEL